MGTPFIRARPRQLPWYLTSPWYLGSICALALALLVALGIWDGPSGLWWSGRVFALLSLVSSALLLVPSIRHGGALAPELEDRQRRIVQALAYPATLVQVLQAWVNRDEARLHLRVLDWVSQLPSKLQSLALRFASREGLSTLWSISLFVFFLAVQTPVRPDPVRFIAAPPQRLPELLILTGPPNSEERRQEIRRAAARMKIYGQIIAFGQPALAPQCLEALVALEPQVRWQPTDEGCRQFSSALSFMLQQTKQADDEQNLRAEKRRLLPWAASAGVLVGIFSLLIAQIAQLAIFAGAFALRSHKLAFGEPVIDSWLCEISAQHSLTLDDGAVSLCPVEPADLTDKSGGLRHSAFYKEPKVIRRLAEWVANVPRIRTLPRYQREALRW
jgi:hypothetical protein